MYVKNMVIVTILPIITWTLYAWEYYPNNLKFTNNPEIKLYMYDNNLEFVDTYKYLAFCIRGVASIYAGTQLRTSWDYIYIFFKLKYHI